MDPGDGCGAGDKSGIGCILRRSFARFTAIDDSRYNERRRRATVTTRPQRTGAQYGTAASQLERPRRRGRRSMPAPGDRRTRPAEATMAPLTTQRIHTTSRRDLATARSRGRRRSESIPHVHAAPHPAIPLTRHERPGGGTFPCPRPPIPLTNHRRISSAAPSRPRSLSSRAMHNTQRMCAPRAARSARSPRSVARPTLARNAALTSALV